MSIVIIQGRRDRLVAKSRTHAVRIVTLFPFYRKFIRRKQTFVIVTRENKMVSDSFSSRLRSRARVSSYRKEDCTIQEHFLVGRDLLAFIISRKKLNAIFNSQSVKIPPFVTDSSIIYSNLGLNV